MNDPQYDDLFDYLRHYINAIDESFMGGNQEMSFSELLEDILDPESSSFELEDQAPPATDEFARLLKCLEELKFEAKVVPYSKITEIVFNETQIELLDMLEDYLEDNWSYYQQNNDISEDLKRKFLKIKEHVGLSTLQSSHVSSRIDEKIGYFDRRYNEVRGELADFRSKFSHYRKEFKEFDKKLFEIEEQYDKIVAQFISILGIFAAILMGAFGSIQGFTSIFNNGDLPIGKLLVLSSIGGSAVVLILFFLLNGVSKLTGNSLSSCNCDSKVSKKTNRQLRLQRTSLFFRDIDFNNTDDGNPNQCRCSLLERHPSLVIIHYILYFIASTGFVLIYLDNQSDFNSSFNSPFNIWLTVIIAYAFVVSSLLSIHFLYTTKRKKAEE